MIQALEVEAREGLTIWLRCPTGRRARSICRISPVAVCSGPGTAVESSRATATREPPDGVRFLRSAIAMQPSGVPRPHHGCGAGRFSLKPAVTDQLSH